MDRTTEKEKSESDTEMIKSEKWSMGMKVNTLTDSGKGSQLARHKTVGHNQGQRHRYLSGYITWLSQEREKERESLCDRERGQYKIIIMMTYNMLKSDKHPESRSVCKNRIINGNGTHWHSHSQQPPPLPNHPALRHPYTSRHAQSHNTATER